MEKLFETVRPLLDERGWHLFVLYTAVQTSTLLGLYTKGNTLDFFYSGVYGLRSLISEFCPPLQVLGCLKKKLINPFLRKN
jgi:hypothetical protein